MARKKNRYRAERVQRKQTIRRALKAVFAVCTAVAGIVLLSAALGRGYQALLRSPWLSVQEIKISGANRVDRTEILNAMMVPKGAPMLDFNRSDIVSRLGELPWLRSSSVRFELPGRLVVDVKEREPLAVIQADELFLLDTEGKLFAKTTMESNPSLFLVNGFYGMNFQEGDSLPPEPLESLRGLLTALKKSESWLPRKMVSECQWRAGTGFIIVAAEGGVPIQIGTEEFDVKMDRLRRIYEMLQSRQWMELVTRIDLDYTDKAYVEGQFPPAPQAKGG